MFGSYAKSKSVMLANPTTYAFLSESNCTQLQDRASEPLPASARLLKILRGRHAAAMNRLGFFGHDEGNNPRTRYTSFSPGSVIAYEQALRPAI